MSLHEDNWKNFIGIVPDESFLRKSVNDIQNMDGSTPDTYWLKCCSAFGSKTTNDIDEPGPILSETQNMLSSDIDTHTLSK